jgi:uncharacterized protein
MALPLMPKATAVWLIENTTMTFQQIADFCGLHPLEVKGIADGEVAKGIVGVDPIMSGQLTDEEIKRCENDDNAKLTLADSAIKHMHSEAKKKKGSKYTPVARRQDKPDAIAWILKNCPELTDAQIVKLIGTTKSTVGAVKNKSHWNTTNIKPKDPVLLGLCSQIELDKLYDLVKKKVEAKKKLEIDEEIKVKSNPDAKKTKKKAKGKKAKK